MGVKFITLKEQAQMPLHTLKERTYLDADGKATSDESAAQSLLGIEGDEITMEQAYSAGLVKTEPKPEEEAAPTMLYYDAEGKRVKEGDANVASQYLDNDPNRPDAQAASGADAGDLNAMTKAELVALAEERGVKVGGNQNKADYIAALEAASAG